MQQRDRILAKIDELRGYLRELMQIQPKSFQEYSSSIEKRRSTERLLQISIECVMDVCSLLVSKFRLGLPTSEEDILDKVESAGVLEVATIRNVRRMRAFRNILVHRYAKIDDRTIYDVLMEKLPDFETFIEETLRILQQQTSNKKTNSGVSAT